MQTTWPNTKIDHFRPCLAKKNYIRLRSKLILNWELVSLIKLLEHVKFGEAAATSQLYKNT